MCHKLKIVQHLLRHLQGVMNILTILESKTRKLAYFVSGGRKIGNFFQIIYSCHHQANHWILASEIICTSLWTLDTFYLIIFTFHETFSIALCHSFVFLRMNFLRVKGVVREARHISEAMTRLFSPKEAICEMCEMSQIGNLKHLRKDRY